MNYFDTTKDNLTKKRTVENEMRKYILLKECTDVQAEKWRYMKTIIKKLKRMENIQNMTTFTQVPIISMPKA